MPSSISSRTQSRAIDGTSTPLIENTGPAGAYNGSVIEVLRGDAQCPPLDTGLGRPPTILGRHARLVVFRIVSGAGRAAVSGPYFGMQFVHMNTHGGSPPCRRWPSARSERP